MVRAHCTQDLRIPGGNLQVSMYCTHAYLRKVGGCTSNEPARARLWARLSYRGPLLLPTAVPPSHLIGGELERPLLLLLCCGAGCAAKNLATHARYLDGGCHTLSIT